MKKIILDLDELLKKVEYLKKNDKRIVFTNGCFDVVHSGHVYYLKKAKQLGDILLVAINSDSSVKRIKGNKRPIIDEMNRLILLESFYFIDLLTLFYEDTPYNLISHIKPDILVKGGDWDIENIVGKDVVEQYGGKVLTIPYKEGFSTTKLINKIKEIYCFE